MSLKNHIDISNLQIGSEVLIQSIEASNLSHTISSIEGDNELLYVNQAFVDATGFSREESIGKNCRFLQGENTDPKTVQVIKDALVNVRPIDIEILNYKKDGTPFWNRLRIAPVSDKEGKPLAFIGVQSDITHIRENLRTEYERKKFESIGLASINFCHELKNLLQPINVASEMLMDWKTLKNEEVDKVVKLIQDSANLASSLSRNVLKFSSLSDVNSKEYSIQALKESLQDLIPPFLPREAVLSESTTDELSCLASASLQVDLNQFQQVVINLIMNAVNANKHEVLKLEIHWKTLYLESIEFNNIGDVSGKFLCLSIQDNGPGINPDELDTIFDPFVSFSNGSGLGLYISRALVSGWGGSITAESSLGSGSKFNIFIPLLLP